MINFKEDTHTYFDNTGQTYTSMTTVIGKYSNKFEDVSDFWEEYKAIQYLSRGFEDRIKKYNFQVHERIKLLCIEYTGNDFLFEHNEAKEILALAFKTNIFNVNLNYSELITRCKKVVKAYWKQINIKSTTEGTAFHLEKEKIQSCVFRGNEYLLEQWEYNAGFNFKPGFMYNEVRLAHSKYLIAGTSDKIYVTNDSLIIDDWKTNAEIKLKGFNNQKLKYPLNNFNDCEYGKYSIQLGGYAFMLEEIGYTIKDIQFSHYPKNPDGSYYSTPVIYKCTYNKEIIRTLFEDFANKNS